MHFLFLCSISFATSVCASHLFVVQPLDSQFPLIARIGQSYSWTFSANTFGDKERLLNYTARNLPTWVSFEPSTSTFHGTPTTEDVGDTEITIIANNGTSSVASSFTLCVSSYPVPMPNLPIYAQFRDMNPSLSSVFTLAAHSSIATGNPALRIPPGWSFSIGFDGQTFSASNDVYYGLLQSDGTTLPSWMNFNSKTYTLHGITPHESNVATPFVISLKLIVSEKPGYSAVSSLFDLIIAQHELSLAGSSPPSINVTTASPFNISLQSPGDLTGVLVDGAAINPSDIANLNIDTTRYGNWLHYDNTLRLLSGDLRNNNVPLDDKYVLPLMLTTTFNQSLSANYTITIVPSYFLTSELPPLEARQGLLLVFDLSRYVAKSGSREASRVTVSFEPSEVANWLRFNPLSGQLTGIVPAGLSGRCSATFMEYSESTHSTSYTYLPIVVSSDGNIDDVNIPSRHRHKLSSAARARLILATIVILGCLGGLSVLGCLLAVVRKWAKVDDSAVIGEDGINALSGQDRKWYAVASPDTIEKHKSSYGWTESVDLNYKNTSYVAVTSRAASPPNLQSGTVGIGEPSSPERENPNPINNPPLRGVMLKKEFLSMINKTARKVSDKCKTRTKNHLLVGKPKLIVPSLSEDLPMPYSLPSSTFSLGSTLTGKDSVPRRRADFEPPGPPRQVYFQDEALSRRISSPFTYPDLLPRPRLVPFTSASRVPVPQGSSEDSLVKTAGVIKGNRIPSQEARVWRPGPNPTTLAEGDELCVGIHYVQSLGGGCVDVSLPSVPTVATTYDRSSVSSLESSHHGGEGRVIVRVGERFKYRVRILDHISLPTEDMIYRLTTAHGGPVPQFLNHKLNLMDQFVEMSGIPGTDNLGVFDIGVYMNDVECVARTTIEVVGRT